MSVEPSIYAFDMEGMFAFREKSQNLRLLEFVEANGAFQPVFLSAQRPESENRKRFDYRLVDAGVFPPCEARNTHHGIGVSRVSDHRRIPTFAVLGVEKEKESDGESGGQNADHHRHARAERRVDRFVFGRRSRGQRRRRRRRNYKNSFL